MNNTLQKQTRVDNSTEDHSVTKKPPPSSPTPPIPETDQYLKKPPPPKEAGVFSVEPHEQQQQNSPLSTYQQMIEILPGVEVPLRGSIETQEAIEAGFLAGTIICSECTLQIDCIRDAAYVLCPLCHALTPVDSPASKLTKSQYGVGLGFINNDGEDNQDDPMLL